MEDEFLQNGFRKVTEPIEHWLTTYHTGYWGGRVIRENCGIICLVGSMCE